MTNAARPTIMTMMMRSLFMGLLYYSLLKVATWSMRALRVFFTSLENASWSSDASAISPVSFSGNAGFVGGLVFRGLQV